MALDIDRIYDRLVGSGIKTPVRKAYIDLLANKFNKTHKNELLKRLFNLAKDQHNKDITREQLSEFCMSDAEAAVCYAWTVVKHPWPEAEAIIKPEAVYANCYAKCVLHLTDAEVTEWKESDKTSRELFPRLYQGE